MDIEDEDEAPYIISVFFLPNSTKKRSQCSKLSTFVGLEFLRKNTPKQLLQNTIPSCRHRGRKLQALRIHHGCLERPIFFEDFGWWIWHGETPLPGLLKNRNSWAILFLFFFGMQEIKITKIKWKSVRVISFLELQQIPATFRHQHSPVKNWPS